MSNDFLNELLALYPDLMEEYKSEQYRLSLDIIGLMTDLGIGSEKMAEVIGCSHLNYLRLESGDVSIPIDEYKLAISKLNVYKESLSVSYGFLFNKSVTSRMISTSADVGVMETVKKYSNIKHVNSKKTISHTRKSYPVYRGFFSSKKSRRKFDVVLLDKNIEESSNTYQDFIYQY